MIFLRIVCCFGIWIVLFNTSPAFSSLGCERKAFSSSSHSEDASKIQKVQRVSGTTTFQELTDYFQRNGSISGLREYPSEERVAMLNQMSLKEIISLSDPVKSALVYTNDLALPPLFLVNDMKKVAYLIRYMPHYEIKKATYSLRTKIFKHLTREDKEHLNGEQLADLVEGIRIKPGGN